MRFVVVALSIVSVLSLGLVSCGSEAETEQTSALGGKKYGGIYRMNEVQELRSLDPVRLNDAPSHHLVHQIYDLLVDFDSSLTLVPELSTSWEVSPDGLTYTYHLRSGVTFHDSPAFPDGKGRVMTAADVKYCFDRILDARSGTFGASYFTGKVKGAQEFYTATQGVAAGTAPAVDGVSGFRVVNDSTFAVDLIQPFAAFKYYPALGFCYIYPKEAVEKFGVDFFRNPVGTGPFVFSEWTPGIALKLTRNTKYWGRDEAGNQLPFLDGIHLTFVKEEKQQLNEFREGNLEESYRIPSESFRSVVTEQGALTPEWSKFSLHRIPAISTQFYGLLTTAPPFNDKRVRQAFNYAIDRDKIIQYVLLGQAAGPAVHGLVPGSMPGYHADQVKGYTFDREKARQLLEEAGYPGGKGFPATTLQLNSGGGRNQQVAEAIQSMLSENLGIQIGLKTLEWPQHQDLLETGRAPLFRLGWVADYPDPENFLNLFYSKTVPADPKAASPINSTRYNSPQFDSLFERALVTLDDAQRMDLYRQAEQVAVDDAAMLFIYHDLDYRLVQSWVKGYSSNPMDRRDFRAAWFDKQSPATASR